MSNCDNDCKVSGNQCPHGFKHEDFDKLSVSSDSKCPLGYISKTGSESNQCPHGFNHIDFDKLSVSSDSKCPLGYVRKPCCESEQCPCDDA